MSRKTGISSIGIHFPSLFMPIEELAKLRNVDPNKYLSGLGCKNMALCPADYSIADLATEAARRAIKRWGGDKSQIGLIAVGTESAEDISRPLSAWVAENLNLTGTIRSYEVKHACYGGTVAVRQATEWKLAGIAPEKVALVIAADICLYELNDPAEPTQGAGAVALIIDEPRIAEIEPVSYPWSMPVFDFWHPMDKPYPLVNGQFSLECYKKAIRECFRGLANDRDLEDVLKEFQAFCFHTPFPKMVKKAVLEVCRAYGWDDEKFEKYYQKFIDPTMDWNRLCGNAYTASLWIAVAKTLCGLKSGQKITACSYGSGCGAELLTLKAGPLAAKGSWAEDVEKDISTRKKIDGKTYEHMRKTGKIKEELP